MIVSLALMLLGGAAAAPQSAAVVAPSGADIAECVVDNDKGDVRALLGAVPGSPAETRATQKVLTFYGGCNDNKQAQGVFAWQERAQIAEAALSGLIGGKTPDVTTAAGQAGWALALPSGANPAVDYDAVKVGMRMLGDCIVRANPQGALALVRTDRGSAAEAAATGGLSGNLAACLPAGQKLTLKRQDLRLVVAEPLYQMLSR